VSFGPACQGACREGWRSFNEDFLIPLVRRLEPGRMSDFRNEVQLDRTIRFPEYLGRFPAESRQLVRNAVWLLDPTDSQVRSYILRYLSAYFLVEAATRQTNARFFGQGCKETQLSTFLDTNFLFSILGLHDNPSTKQRIR